MSGLNIAMSKEKDRQEKGGETCRPLATARPGNASGSERRAAVEVSVSDHLRRTLTRVVVLA